MKFLGICALVAVLVSGCAHAPSSPRIDNEPMYGQPAIPRDKVLQELDAKFIRDAVAGLGNRERASDVWWAQAEEYFANGNFDYAMRRYNQSWLLNPDSFKPFWGFARVYAQLGPIESAIEYFEKALSMCRDDYQKPALLADFGSALVIKADRQVLEARKEGFAKADALIRQAIALDPSYGNAYKRLAMSLYRQDRLEEAWLMVEQAEKRSETIMPAGFLKALQQKMPRPRPTS